mmetsp:Transcript_112063/g.327771  ORF Transcript_112063/g.327771 Transcript_112063/m.327771 type:complete len:219 (+) Transcript_112063:616-1272(+)
MRPLHVIRGQHEMVSVVVDGPDQSIGEVEKGEHRRQECPSRKSEGEDVQDVHAPRYEVAAGQPRPASRAPQDHARHHRARPGDEDLQKVPPALRAPRPPEAALLGVAQEHRLLHAEEVAAVERVRGGVASQDAESHQEVAKVVHRHLVLTDLNQSVQYNQDAKAENNQSVEVRLEGLRVGGRLLPATGEDAPEAEPQGHPGEVLPQVPRRRALLSLLA